MLVYTFSKIDQKPHVCILTTINVFSLIYCVLACGKSMAARMYVRSGALHNAPFNRVLSHHEERNRAELFESRLFLPFMSEEFEQSGLIMLLPCTYCYRSLK